MGLRARLARMTREWIRRRQGPDGDSVTLRRGRIYILPTGLGVAFGSMLFGMLLASLNYANNLGLVLTFLLGALAIAAMHACHRNLEALVIRAAGAEPSFAGSQAVFRFSLASAGRGARYDLEASASAGAGAETNVAPESDALLEIRVPTRRRGCIVLSRLEIATRFPYGLFRAWAVLHPHVSCVVYPRPAAGAPPPQLAPGGAGGAARRGEEDFAGLKDYHPGDPPRHIAWKAYARADELLVKEFSGASEAIPVFDLAEAPGADLEARLSVLARWIVDASAGGMTFGLRLPGSEIPPEPGEAQRRRCLAAIARFEAPAADVA
jgi:uncharacterized protein (DUF58 family)